MEAPSLKGMIQMIIHNLGKRKIHKELMNLLQQRKEFVKRQRGLLKNFRKIKKKIKQYHKKKKKKNKLTHNLIMTIMSTKKFC